MNNTNHATDTYYFSAPGGRGPSAGEPGGPPRERPQQAGRLYIRIYYN